VQKRIIETLVSCFCSTYLTEYKKIGATILDGSIHIVTMPLVSFANGDNNRQDSVVSASKEGKESQREFTKPQDGYWGRRCWDPSVTWTAAEEARVVRKTDLHLLAFFCIVTIAILIDRGVIYNALTDDFLVDSGLTRQDYKLGLQISRLGVWIAQYPLQLAVNRFGFKHTFSPLLLCWGVIGKLASLTLNWS